MIGSPELVIAEIAKSLAENGLTPETLAAAFQKAFASEKLGDAMEKALKDRPESTSQNQLLKDLVKRELDPVIYEENPRPKPPTISWSDGRFPKPDGPFTAREDVNFTGHPSDVLRKGEKFNIGVVTGGETSLREQFKPGGKVETLLAGLPDKSVIFVSYDFRHLPLDEQQSFRKRMRDEKVVIVPNLPESEALDRCYERAVGRTGERKRNEGLESGGPEDKKFDQDKNKPLEDRGEKCFDTSGRGRPTPDTTSVDETRGTKTYWEDKRPSECKEGGNSWLYTYRKGPDGRGSDDPIAEVRTKAKADFDKGEITRAEAEASIIIAENDDHYRKKNAGVWTDPDGVSSDGLKEGLGIRLPDTEENQDRIAAIEKKLREQGRNPQLRRENGVAYITYDVPDDRGVLGSVDKGKALEAGLGITIVPSVSYPGGFDVFDKGRIVEQIVKSNVTPGGFDSHLYGGDAAATVTPSDSDGNLRRDKSGHLDFSGGQMVGTPDRDQRFWEHQTMPIDCAVVAQRGIIQAFTGKDISEAQVVYEATTNGWLRDGGMAPRDVGKLLELHGIPVHQCQDATVKDLVSELALGHKVIVGVDSGELWNTDSPIASFFRDSADHAIWVTGVSFKDPDHPTVVINDSGDPTGAGKEYDLHLFVDAWEDSGFFYVATDKAPLNIAGLAEFDRDEGCFGGMKDYFGDMYNDFREILKSRLQSPEKITPGEIPVLVSDAAARSVIENLPENPLGELSEE